ncbi:DUF6235 family protein [Amycolatopsis sp. H20-H5]|uniref:DUF6235 family protein n=1 Tax=Amycolatopsis sp. H20-H5 TaxID=3046309 RepID=UPI002DBE71D0|nr:DUF6235 family protein [Amycolatopsis sp. H20-H5]MEC3976940.1 DUF6235 family protein [Amycolatopsis sp. H20-H5]
MSDGIRLVSGLQVLDHWSGSACQADKNVVYKALFSVVDGSVFLTYDILEEDELPQQFLVLVKSDLVTQISLHHADSFGIAYIGPIDGAMPGQMPLS